MSESGTIGVREGEGFDAATVGRYLRKRVEGMPEGDPDVRQFPAGASNLTYLLKVGDWEGVLRRPPLGPVPARAHDMGREFGILDRLHAAYPLAPKPYVFCEDESVIGAPFYVMEFRAGAVLDRTLPPGVNATEALCRGISETVVDTLVDLHAVDPNEAGLGDIGRPEGFLERQVKGWASRYEKARTDDVPEAGSLVRRLAEDVPRSPDPAVIHNDYKLNNLVLDPGDLTKVRAVLDWEMATVGDPLFDLGVSLSYWVEAGDPEELRAGLPTVASISPHFFTRREFLGRYAERSGRDLSSVGWYVTFGYFKMAVIAQQIYVRWKKGQTRDPRFADLGAGVRFMIRRAGELSRREET